MRDAKQKTRDVLASISHHISGQGTACGHGHHWISCRTKCQGEEIGADMLLTQGVPYIDREELGLSYISCPSLLRFRGPRHDNINLNISLYIVDHYLNIGLLELWSIVCQIHIEKESDVWFGRHSQWLAHLADLPRQPFGLVFSLRSMQTSWGVLS